MQSILPELITVAISILGFAFAYGRLSERVRTLETQTHEAEVTMKEQLQAFRNELNKDTVRFREEIEKETRHLDTKFRSVESQIQVLRNEVFSMRDKLYDEISHIRQLLFEIKGRLEERKQ